MSFPDTLESPQDSPAGAHLPAAPDLAGQASPEPEKMARPKTDCRSPVGLDCCNCCLDLAHRSGLGDSSGENNNPGSPTVSNFRQLQEKLIFENLNTDKLNSIMRQDSLEPVLRDPCYLLNEGICNRNIDQTMLSILLFFHRWVAGQMGGRASGVAPASAGLSPDRRGHWDTGEVGLTGCYDWTPKLPRILMGLRGLLAGGSSVLKGSCRGFPREVLESRR